MTAQEIKSGLRFEHKRVLSTESFDGKTPQPYMVTCVRNGYLYYRPIYAMGRPEERLGAADCADTNYFLNYAMGKIL